MPQAAHVTRTATIHLNGPIEHVFPLFEPVGEARWVAGWQPRFLWPADGKAQVGTTFTTDERGRESYWMVAEYEPGRRVVYSHLVPGSRAGRIEVRCVSAPEGKTAAGVRYDLTALGPVEEDRLLRMSDDDFRSWIGEWETAINGVLAGDSPVHHH
ncbi:MAG TPA: hypothetical protein VF541_03890 [Longimicrobium sp.]